MLNISDSNKIKIVFIAFFLSGFSALVYEIIWMRMLSLTFGTTVFAATTVITSYMAGLAIGSFFGGRFADRQTKRYTLLKYYAFIELFVGLSCLLTPLIFYLLEYIYKPLYLYGEDHFYIFSLLRFSLSFLVLFIPTALMGATLPILIKFVVREVSLAGKSTGTLYGINTLGAVTGVFITAFVLIPWLGMHGALFLAVACNLLIFAFIYFILLSYKEQGGEMKEGYIAWRDSFKIFLSGKKGVLFAAFLLSGFCSLGYEVLWFRVLSMTIGNTVYAFSVMLAVFLFGIGLGSWLFSVFSDKVTKHLAMFVLVELLIAVSSVLLLPLFGNLPILFLGFMEQFGYTFVALQFVNFFTAFLVLIIPTLLMGVSFPLALHIFCKDKKTLGVATGILYSGNTVGSVLGSFIAGFILIPLIGVQSSILFFAMINVLIALSLLFAFKEKSIYKLIVSGTGIFVLTASLVLPAWDKALLSTGVFVNAPNYMKYFEEDIFLEGVEKALDVKYYSEGTDSTVTVMKRVDNMVLTVNGKPIADVNSDPFTNTLLGSVPLMLHESPKSALLIGLGSGVTLGAMEQFPLEDIYALEISPEVVKASKYFSEYNFNALEDDRLKLIVDDARSYLAYKDLSYDVIVSQPSVPWMSGAANLYTKDFYDVVSTRLNEGGLFFQWIQAFGMDYESLSVMVNSFKGTFEHVSLWVYKPGNVLLLGSNEPFDWSYLNIFSKFKNENVRDLLLNVSIKTPEDLFSGLLAEDKGFISSAFSETAINTYDRPIIEYSSPKTLFTDTTLDNYNKMVEKLYIIRPEIKDTFVRTGEKSYRYPLMGLDAELKGDWKHIYAGFEYLTKPVTEFDPKSFTLDKSFSRIAILEKSKERPDIEDSALRRLAEKNFQFSNRQMLIIKNKGRSSKDIKGELFLSKMEEVIDKEAKVKGVISGIGNGVAYMISGKAEEAVLYLAWQCKESGLLFDANLIPAKSVDSFLKDMPQMIKCM